MIHAWGTRHGKDADRNQQRAVARNASATPRPREGTPYIVFVRQQQAATVALNVVSVAVKAGGNEDKVGLEIGDGRQQVGGDECSEI